MPGIETGIADLDTIVDSLSSNERELFHRIYRVGIVQGQIRPPQSMHPWIEEQFGSLDRTLEQRIVRITNLITLEEALFNQLRGSRPGGAGIVCEDSSMEKESFHVDPFKDPLASTPEDIFGRIEGKYCITASNVAKYEGFHGVIIFKEVDPLRFTEEQVVDYIDTGLRWAQEAHTIDPEAKYFFFMWNCGGRAGASLPHGHAQVMLGKERHYAKIEQLRCASLSYRGQYETQYFDDLYTVHRLVGCGFDKNGVNVLAYLTPVKEKETILIAPKLDKDLKETIYEVMACFRDRLAVGAFNVAISMPPIAPADENWEGFPVIVRVVDRGSVSSRASDIGAMELYASTVISTDPFEIAQVVKAALK
ncbi:MAG: hypothetical protein JSW38_11500 [Dehalococcoidia bacterium]|nr:MAG: hypothetical protein JSV02_01095 [Dehalococcoidia bacterium]UCG82791.1 MAG: hypothetical protein JSW38_11500 [Dehalococcoidia bacterium]